MVSWYCNVSKSLMIYLIFISNFNAIVGKFEPYADNGGTLVGIAGTDFCILACDTRLSDSYVIKSRNISRIFEISDGILLSASGCLSDTLELKQVLIRNSKLFTWENDFNNFWQSELSVHSTARRAMLLLFDFAFCAVAGLDERGGGALYRYDAVGSFERVRAVCAGKGERLIQPLLDEITGMEEDDSADNLWCFSDAEDSFSSAEYSPKVSSSPELDSRKFMFNFTAEDGCDLVGRVFRAAAEREISVGDGVDIWIIRQRKIIDVKINLNVEIFNDSDSSHNGDQMVSTDTKDTDLLGLDRGYQFTEDGATPISLSYLPEIRNDNDDTRNRTMELSDSAEKLENKTVQLCNEKRDQQFFAQRGFFQIEKRTLSLPRH